MKKNVSSKQAVKPMDPQTALQKSAALCSRQEMCSFQIREKLKIWEVKEDDTEKIIKQLRKEKFLDDSRFAGFYTRDKFRFNAWGKIKIAHMLRMKGIDERDIENSLTQIGEEEYLEACKSLIRSKARKLSDPPGFARKGKIYRFASGKGFESEIIYKALEICGEN